MKKSAIFVGGVLGLVLLLLLGAFILPAQITVERTLAIQGSPDRIHEYLTHAETFERWSPWAQRDPAMEIRHSGPEQGEGLVMEWRSEREPDGRYEVTGGEQGAFVLHHLTVGDQLAGEGRFEIEPERTRQRVTWSVTLQAGANPLSRYLLYLREDALGESMLSGLTHLKVRVESDRSPFPDQEVPGGQGNDAGND